MNIGWITPPTPAPFLPPSDIYRLAWQPVRVVQHTGRLLATEHGTSGQVCFGCGKLTQWMHFMKHVQGQECIPSACPWKSVALPHETP